MSSLVMSLQFVGLKEVISSLNGASARLDSELERRMKVLVLEVAGAAQRHIYGTRAGNPPDVLGMVTGRLRGSIVGNTRRAGVGEIEGVISPSAVVYAATHEIGDPSRNIPARPYLARGLADKKERIVDFLGGAFSASVVFGG